MATEHQPTASVQPVHNPSPPAPSDGVPTITATSLSPCLTTSQNCAADTLNTGSHYSAYIPQGMFRAYISYDDRYGGHPKETFARKVAFFQNVVTRMAYKTSIGLKHSPLR